MSDELDIATEYTDAFITKSLSNHKKRQLKYSLRVCKDCGDEIPKERAKIMNVNRCVYCQDYYEKTRKNYLLE